MFAWGGGGGEEGKLQIFSLSSAPPLKNALSGDGGNSDTFPPIFFISYWGRGIIIMHMSDR